MHKKLKKLKNLKKIQDIPPAGHPVYLFPPLLVTGDILKYILYYHQKGKSDYE